MFYPFKTTSTQQKCPTALENCHKLMKAQICYGTMITTARTHTHTHTKPVHYYTQPLRSLVPTDVRIPIGDSERFSTVARSSSTLAEMGAAPLLSGLISTWIFFSSRSSSLSLSELE